MLPLCILPGRLGLSCSWRAISQTNRVKTPTGVAQVCEELIAFGDHEGYLFMLLTHGYTSSVVVVQALCSARALSPAVLSLRLDELRETVQRARRGLLVPPELHSFPS